MLGAVTTPNDNEVLTTRTKGLRLFEPVPVADVRQVLQRQPLAITNDLFSWPLLALDDDALQHNITTMADLCSERKLWHAPHVKTPMSGQIWARQKKAGAWAATVASLQQLRTAYSWGARRLLLANELVDPRDAVWLRAMMVADPDLDLWLQVDSFDGVQLLAAYLTRMEAANDRVHILIEFGVKDGRTGVRTAEQALALAQAVAHAGLRVSGITGFEMPAATGDAPSGAVAIWCDRMIVAAEAIVGNVPTAWPFVISAGGSAYLDVVIDKLADPTGARQLVVRSGAYVTHDHGHYARLNPWARLPGNRSLHQAITIWTQVVSAPQSGWAYVNAGRRDISFDLGLPVPLWRQSPGGPRVNFAPGQALVTELNDQHAFLKLSGVDLCPGDLVGLGISHPCTALDKWRIGLLTHDDPVTGQTMVIDLYTLDF